MKILMHQDGEYLAKLTASEVEVLCGKTPRWVSSDTDISTWEWQNKVKSLYAAKRDLESVGKQLAALAGLLQSLPSIELVTTTEVSK